MSRSLAFCALTTLSVCASCDDKVDLGGKDALESSGEGGEAATAGNAQGGSQPRGGDTGTGGGGHDADGGASDGGSGAKGDRGGAGMSGGAGGATSGGAGTGGSAGVGGGGMGGGGAGVGGAGVGGSIAGSGGAECGGPGGPTCPECPDFGTTIQVETCLLGDDVLASDAFAGPTAIDESVTVVSVTASSESMDMNPCRGYGGYASERSIHVVVEAMDQRRWTLVLGLPDLPADFTEPGETFELSVVTFPPANLFDFADQAIQLWRGSELVLFGAVGTKRSPSTGPVGTGIHGLDGSGVVVTNEEILCTEGSTFDCQYEYQRTRVVIGTSEAVFNPNETQRVGDFSVTMGSAVARRDWGSCDEMGLWQVAGVRVVTKSARERT